MMGYFESVLTLDVDAVAPSGLLASASVPNTHLILQISHAKTFKISVFDPI